MFPEIVFATTAAFFGGYLLGFFQSLKFRPEAEADPRDG